jgi:TPR repeat protein
MYADGSGVSQNLAEAAEWYRKAAEQGVTYAQNNLAVMYERGEGVPRDLRAALEWYKRADQDEQEQVVDPETFDRLEKLIQEEEGNKVARDNQVNAISDAELSAAVVASLIESGPLAAEGLLTAAAGRLGFKRVEPKLRERLTGAINQLVGSGELSILSDHSVALNTH